MAYTREDIVEAGLLRFRQVSLCSKDLEEMFYNYYDKVGKDTFRIAASVNAAAMRTYFGEKQ